VGEDAQVAEQTTAGGRQRNTRQAAAVEQVLRDADGFRTAQELFAEVRSRGHAVGLTTVYRHLNALAAGGMADVVHRPDGESQFRLCGESDAADRHHHHVVCRVCGRSVEVSGPEVEDWAARVAHTAGFTEVSHTVEVFGLCPEHSRTASAPGVSAR
jgi:Fur family ferric uptake transcriptional regulator